MFSDLFHRLNLKFFRKALVTHRIILKLQINNSRVSTNLGAIQASLFHGYVEQVLQLVFRSDETPHVMKFSPQASTYEIYWYNNLVLAYWYQPALNNSKCGWVLNSLC